MAAHASVIACQRRSSVGAAVVRHLAWLVDQHASRGAKAGASGGRERSRAPPAAWGAWRWSPPPTGPGRRGGPRTAGTQARNAPPSPTPATRLAATPPPRPGCPGSRGARRAWAEARARAWGRPESSTTPSALGAHVGRAARPRRFTWAGAPPRGMGMKRSVDSLHTYESCVLFG